MQAVEPLKLRFSTACPPSIRPCCTATSMACSASAHRGLHRSSTRHYRVSGLVLRPLGAVPGLMTPDVCREPEIIELLSATRKLGPAGGLRQAVMATVFGLVACTGLRISEALRLLDTA